MKIQSVLFLSAAVLIFGFGSEANAHPGNTAADGCHYCRTNCDKWGVPWNERHCHNAKPKAAPKALKPAATKKKIDPCSYEGLLATYKSKKAAGEKMENLSTKSWWKICPAETRKKVYDAVK